MLTSTDGASTKNTGEAGVIDMRAARLRLRPATARAQGHIAAARRWLISALRLSGGERHEALDIALGYLDALEVDRRENPGLDFQIRELRQLAADMTPDEILELAAEPDHTEELAAAERHMARGGALADQAAAGDRLAALGALHEARAAEALFSASKPTPSSHVYSEEAYTGLSRARLLAQRALRRLRRAPGRVRRIDLARTPAWLRELGPANDGTAARVLEAEAR